MDPDPKRDEGNRRCCICCLVTLGTVVLIFTILVILCLTAFRPRHAVTTVNSIRLSSVDAGLNLPKLALDINVTLDLSITVYNPNRVSFRYPSGGTADLYYRGMLVGDAMIPPGEIGSKDREVIEVKLTVFAGKLAGDASVYADVISGSVNLATFTSISGKVSVIGIIKVHVESYTNCDVEVNVRNRTVENSNCRYKTKI